MNDVTQFGAGVEDVEAAIRFVKEHAAEYRIDPNRIALVGESAGGQLAAMAALSEDPAIQREGSGRALRPYRPGRNRAHFEPSAAMDPRQPEGHAVRRD